MSNRAILLVLDGFGIGKSSPFNAIQNAKMPFYQEIWKKYPHSELMTHGEYVGLPKGIMGNSEVGHMTMGAGKTIYQDLTRISKSIEDKSFFQNSVLRQTLEAGASNSGQVHLMGLLSDGGVHSHIDHLFALLDLCISMRIPKVSIHPILDGRDTPPESAAVYLKQLLAHSAFAPDATHGTRATIATVMGRFWAMDRDQRWDRISSAYLALTGQKNPVPAAGNFAVLEFLQSSYNHTNPSADKKSVTDEFIEPTVFSPDHTMKDGDSVVFFNFRSDRAREITQAITEKDFKFFDRGRGFKPSVFTGMTVYDKTFTQAQVAFAPQGFQNIFGEWLEKKQRTQLRIAETEKYAHVTFFFNGGREIAFKGEDRALIPSAKEVPTYDLKPEMSAFGIAAEVTKRIQQEVYDFILINFANADMVGHTGDYAATVRAVEVLDQCLSQVIGTAEKSGYHVLLTADHGNAEEMQDFNGHRHTQHTLNPVPALWIAPNSSIAPRSSRQALQDGSLSDVMPTLCDLMGLDLPPEATGKSLIPG